METTNFVMNATSRVVNFNPRGFFWKSSLSSRRSEWQNSETEDYTHREQFISRENWSRSKRRDTNIFRRVSEPKMIFLLSWGGYYLHSEFRGNYLHLKYIYNRREFHGSATYASYDNMMRCDDLTISSGGLGSGKSEFVSKLGPG